MYDHLIRGGTVVDGTGEPGSAADVAIQDGMIAAIGDLADAPADVVTDATDRVVCPGFIDPHTHYDAQLFWDPHATPSNLHGVTTIVGGNCGFTLAPINPEDADYLRRMMAKVEGMPLPALENGLDWNWRSFGDYLGRLEGSLGVNAGFLVGHAALRRNVMGADAVGREATDDQIARMCDLLRESIAAGGMGFSTSLAYTHSDGDGNPIPSRWATHDEVVTLASVVSEFEGTTLEFVTDGCMDQFSEAEIELMINMSLAGGRPLNWNVLTIDSKRRAQVMNQIGASERAAAAGARVVALTMPTLVGMNMSFGFYCALNMLPDWGEILGLPLEERKAKLADPEVRAFLLARAASPEAGVFSRLTGWDRYRIGDTFSPANDGLTGRTVGEIAAERGAEPFDTLVDIALADDLRTILWPAPTDDDHESWALRAELWENEHTMIGGSDAGAHLDRMCGTPYTTEWLADCIRGQQLMAMERAVHHLTQVPAELFGFRKRGLVREGFHADLVVFDPATIGAEELRLIDDLPGGTSRLFAGSTGIDLVLCNGTPTVEGGRSTTALPGRLLAPGRDTTTNQVPGATR